MYQPDRWQPWRHEMYYIFVMTTHKEEQEPLVKQHVKNDCKKALKLTKIANNHNTIHQYPCDSFTTCGNLMLTTTHLVCSLQTTNV